MRVVAGTAKGHRLVAPKGRRVRPTADRVKESLFDILGERVHGASVLDLYAGSGALGIEALSRGASLAVFVDHHRDSVAASRRNLEATGLATSATVLQRPVIDALAQLAGQASTFDLIFLDPPYTIGSAELAATFGLLETVCRDDGLVVLEHRPDLTEFATGRFRVTDRRRYGDSALTFFEKTGA